jgi:hypothetical protein
MTELAQTGPESIRDEQSETQTPCQPQHGGFLFHPADAYFLISDKKEVSKNLPCFFW